MSDPEARTRRHRELRDFARRLRALVTEAANEADPIGLIGMGAPQDEYSPEVGDITAALAHLGHKPDQEGLKDLICVVFTKWFGDTPRDERAIGRMAETICARWDDLKPPSA